MDPRRKAVEAEVVRLQHHRLQNQQKLPAQLRAFVVEVRHDLLEEPALDQIGEENALVHHDELVVPEIGLERQQLLAQKPLVAANDVGQERDALVVVQLILI